jgi:hypothetical protein
MKDIKKKTWEEAKYPKIRIPQSLYDDVKAFAEKRNLSIGEVLNWAWNKGIKQYEKVEFPTFRTMREKMEREIKAKIEDEIRADYESKIKALEDENNKLIYLVRDAVFENEKLAKENKELKEINVMFKQRIDDLERQLKEFEALNVDALIKERDDWKNKAKEWESKAMDERALKSDVIKELDFMKNEVCKRLKAIAEFEASVKPLVDCLINDIQKKADYELERLKD